MFIFPGLAFGLIFILSCLFVTILIYFLLYIYINGVVIAVVDVCPVILSQIRQDKTITSKFSFHHSTHLFKEQVIREIDIDILHSTRRYKGI